MASQQDLTNIAISSGFATLLHTEDSGGVTSSFTDIYDGDGTRIPLAVSTTAVKIIDGSFDFDIASHDGTNGLKLGGTLVTASASEINYLDVSSIGSAQASKALILDSNLDISGIRNLTATGTIQALNFTATGDTAIGNSVANDTLAINSTITTNLVFEGSTDNSFETTLAITDPTADRTLTLPDATDTLVGKATTDTLTNKTLDIDNNTLSNVEVDNLKSGVLDTDISSVSGSDDTLASAKAIKTYVDAQDANIASDTLTFTNKTFDVEASGNSISNIDVADLKSGVLDTDISSVSSSDDTLASAKAIKTYIDSQVTAQDLDFQGDSGGALSIDLDSETLDIAGGTGIDTSGSSNTLTVAIDSTVATLTGSQTLTNKTLTSPDINGGSADALTSLTVANNVDIGNHTLTANGLTIDGTFTDGSLSIASGSITNAVSGTFSGTIQAEQLTTTDDATISDQLSVDGTMTISTGSIVDSSGAIDFGNENLSTSGTLGAGAGTLTSLSVTDGNITNVGDIALDTISADDTAITFSSPVNFNSQATTNANIDSGNIDGVTIATSNITVGSSKTLDVSAGTLTLADNQISGDKVEGGTIASTTITALTTAGITASSNLDIGDFTIRANNFLADSQTATQVAFYGTNGVLSGDSDMTFSGSTLSVTDLAVSGTLTTTGSVQEVSTTNLNVQDPLILLNKYDSQPTNNAFDAGFIIKRGSGDSAPANVGFIFDESANQFALIDTTDDGTTAGNVGITDYENLRIGALTADDASTFTSTISTASGSTIGNLTLADGSITSGSGALSFGNENLSTSGTLSAGAITGTSFIIGSADISEAELEILDGASVTTAELNIMDGDTTATSTTVADADRVVFNDGGTMKQVAVTDLSAYFDDEITAMPNLTSVGTLTALQVDNININGNTIISSDTDGNINLTPNGTGEVNISKVDIDAGDISGTDITVGSGKTLNVSAGTLTLANDQISGDAINGGTIGSITISQLAGALDANNQAITNVDINSGAIDGTNIGANSAGTGAFTTLTASGNSTFSSKVGINGAIDSSFAGATIHGTSMIKTTPSDGSENRFKFHTGGAGDNPKFIIYNNDGSTEDFKIDNGTITSVSGATFGDDVTISSSTTAKPELTILNTNADASAPELVFKKDSSSPADNDEAGRIYMFADDDAGNATEAFLAISKLTDVSNGSEDSSFEMYTLAGGSQKLTLSLSSSNVGIGTSSPSSLLHLKETDGDANAGPILTLQRDNSASEDNNDVLGEIQFQGSDSANTTTNVYAQINAQIEDISHTSEDGRLHLQTQVAGTMTDTLVCNSGKVGIGTTSPTSILDVETASGGSLLYEDSGDGLLSLLSSGGTALIRFEARSGENNYINNGGNVGIGTTSPASKLHINDGSLRVVGSNERILVIEDGSQNSVELGHSTSSTHDGFMALTDDSGTTQVLLTSGTNANYINNGNVGIGTTSPQRDFVISNGGAGGIEFDASDSTNIMSVFNRSTSSYPALQFEASSFTFAPQGGGVIIDSDTNDPKHLELRSTNDIAHGMTDLENTATFFRVSKNSNDDGGAQIAGYTENNLAVEIVPRVVNEISASSPSTSDQAPFQVVVAKKSSGSVQSLDASKMLVAFRNNSDTRFIFDSDGRGYADNTFTTFSDSRLKKDVVEIPYGLETVNKLKPKKYIRYAGDMKDGKVVLEENGWDEIGFIAQDVKEIVPELISNPDCDESKGFYAMDDGKMTSILVKAIQELSQKVEQLEKTCKDCC